ncbi:solute carrier family 13 member 2 [Aplysia californica]|uniref:Solute carrier family 13 member 2 n=1 Tax=Aplysia californica TaxID=6500 RepID=A0ABM1A6F7_APLCA|nr:solute carrier family 13 member 2 [Aplysia californica]
MHVHPLYLMLPTTAACSLAFMLPVATPPNALVFAYGDVKVTDMIKCGFILNMLGVAVISLGINTWGHAAFSLDSFPTWAQGLILQDPNATLSDVLTTTTVPDFVGNWTVSGNISTYL